MPDRPRYFLECQNPLHRCDANPWLWRVRRNRPRLALLRSRPELLVPLLLRSGVCRQERERLCQNCRWRQLPPGTAPGNREVAWVQPLPEFPSRVVEAVLEEFPAPWRVLPRLWDFSLARTSPWRQADRVERMAFSERHQHRRGALLFRREDRTHQPEE